MLAGVALVLAVVQAPPDSGAALFASWCKSCHGADGRGTPAASTRLEVPPADLHECKGSTAETEDRWVKIVAQGGAAFGLSLDMPAFGEAGTPAQIRAVVRYARSLCGELGWPPGELNFPRAFLVEKAYPEDEVVITDEARGQEYIYEHRLGKRFQLEAGWTVPAAAEHTLSFYPQVWVRLSRLGHVAGSLGAELPAVGPEPRRPRLIAFVLWDFGDAPLLHGW